MNYVTSDIHGCRREFEALFKKIKFSSQDTLYIIGDMIDRGPDSMGVLKIMASNSNIYPVAGNHEFIMMSVLPRLMLEIKEDNITSVLTCKLRSNGMPVPLLRNGYSIFNGTKYR